MLTRRDAMRGGMRAAAPARTQAADALRRRMRASGSARAPLNSTPSASSARRTSAGSPSAVAADAAVLGSTRWAPAPRRASSAG